MQTAKSLQNERVTYLTSAEHKAALEAFAKSRGESVGQVVREATAKFIGQPTEDEEAQLAALVAEVNKAIPKMNASIDQMIETLRKSHRETDELLRQMGARK
jgi:flagellar biosynthesis/type III secretory pathway protein FliH